jgi:3',5'-cyclic AMP phosphodiesterase CpdA
MAVLEIPYRTGRLIVLGDLHHDSYMRYGTDPFTAHELDQSLCWDVDALIVAGDLTNMPVMHWRPTLMFLKRFVPASRIYVLPGNHDFYGHLLDEEDDLRLIAEIAGANFVQKKELRLGATRILVCTLWTDFALTGDQKAAMSTARHRMSDYTAMHKTGPLNNLSVRRPQILITPADTLALHRDHRAWLEEQLAGPHFAGPAGRTIVVTHHGPHLATAGPVDGLTPAFHSNLEDVLLRYAPDVWLFGHSHRRLRARIGNTDIRNVSIGYPNEARLPEERPLEELCQIDCQDRGLA